MRTNLPKILATLSIFVGMFLSSILINAYFKRDSLTEIVCSPFTEQKDSYVRYCVPNPFRDRDPERVSDKLLNAIKNRQFDQVMPYLRALSKEPEKYIGRESELTISSWRIINRKIEPDGRYHLAYVYSNEASEDEVPIGFYFVDRDDKWILNEIFAQW